MIRNKITEQLYILLPAYINETANPIQRKMIEWWLGWDEEARITAETLRTLQSAVQRQPRRLPPVAVLGRIKAQISNQQATPAQSNKPILSRTLAQRLPLGFPVLLLTLVTLILAATVIWQALPPGIVLQWSVEGRTPETFLVYRAEVDGKAAKATQFELLEEVPASDEGRQYSFTDFRLLPGQTYLYRVEGLNEAGQPAASQTILGQGIDALPGQLATLLVLIFALYCFWHLLQLRRPITTAPI